MTTPLNRRDFMAHAAVSATAAVASTTTAPAAPGLRPPGKAGRILPRRARPTR